MPISVEITGITEVQNRLRQIAIQATPAVAESLYEEAQHIMGVSVRLVPIDTGLLRSTAHVGRPETQGATVSVTLSYGGQGVAPYALLVHESVHIHHIQGQHHFLSQPLYEATAGMAERLAASMRSQLRP